VIKEIHFLYGSLDDLLFAEEVGEAKVVSGGFNGNNVGQDHLFLAVFYDIRAGLTHLEYPPLSKNNGGLRDLST
jgi:hypothetical protein